jgi:hypothetical protein
VPGQTIQHGKFPEFATRVLNHKPQAGPEPLEQRTSVGHQLHALDSCVSLGSVVSVPVVPNRSNREGRAGWGSPHKIRPPESLNQRPGKQHENISLHRHIKLWVVIKTDNSVTGILERLS